MLNRLETSGSALRVIFQLLECLTINTKVIDNRLECDKPLWQHPPSAWCLAVFWFSIPGSGTEVCYQILELHLGKWRLLKFTFLWQDALSYLSQVDVADTYSFVLPSFIGSSFRLRLGS